jgi:HSP20 family protein
MLSLAGERKFEQEEKGKRYHRVECAYGSFARSFELPEDTNPEQIAADFKDGVLHVRIAKSEKTQPKQIQVKVT